MRCICLHLLPQAFYNRISPSAAYFLFMTCNRKTCFPAFSILNELLLQGKTSPQNPPKPTEKARETKAGPFLPTYSFGRQSRTAPDQWFNIRLLWGKRQNDEVASTGSQSALLVLMFAGRPSLYHLLQKEKPVTIIQVTGLRKGQWKGIWLRIQEVQDNYQQRKSFFILEEF